MVDQENPDEGNVTSMMTEEMAERLTPWLGLAPDDHINGRDLISMPARDILLSYLDNMSKNGQGEYTALLVTYSFPAYGFMVRKLQVLTTDFNFTNATVCSQSLGSNGMLTEITLITSLNAAATRKATLKNVFLQM